LVSFGKIFASLLLPLIIALSMTFWAFKISKYLTYELKVIYQKVQTLFRKI